MKELTKRIILDTSIALTTLSLIGGCVYKGHKTTKTPTTPQVAWVNEMGSNEFYVSTYSADQQKPGTAFFQDPNYNFTSNSPVGRYVTEAQLSTPKAKPSMNPPTNTPALPIPMTPTTYNGESK